MADEKPTEIQFYFVKGNQHRVIHVDGAWGGITSSGGVHMSVYSERVDVPSKVVHEVEGNKLGKEKTDRREGGEQIIRELDATLVMNLKTATVIRDWLSEKITLIKDITSSARQKE